MGTYVIKATAVAQATSPNSSWRRIYQQVAAGLILIDSDVIQGINSDRAVSSAPHPTPGAAADGILKAGDPSADGKWLLRLSCGGASIYLDGAATPIAFNDLPPGFEATSAKLQVICAGAGFGPSDTCHLQHNQ